MGAAQLAGRGADLAAEGRFEAAAALFERALQLDGNAAAVHDMLAQCRMEQGQDEEAYEAACSAVCLRPEWPDALVTLGRAARNAGRLQEAATAFGRYLELAAAAAGGGGAAGVQPGAEGNAPAASGRGSAAPAPAAAAAAALAAPDGDEAAAVRQELEEVQHLLQLQLGHQLGLPGLRLLEARGAAAGPGGVAWEAGALLAWFLVQHDKGGGGSVGAPGCDARCSGGPTCMHSGSSGARLPAAAAQDEAAAAAAAAAAASPLRGSRVLELGSGGTGLVGLAAACLGAAVTATDLPAVLPQLEAALAANAGLVAAGGGSMRAAALDWRAPEASALLAPAGGAEAQYAWLLGADLVYSQEALAPLVATVAAAAAHAAARGGEPLRWVRR